jgi:hypothetical protein
MRIKATLIFFFFLFGVAISGCDNKLETSQKVTNSTTVSQTQNIEQPKETVEQPKTTTQEEHDLKAWKKATQPSGYDYSKYNKPLK